MQKTWQDMSGQSHSHPHLEPSSSQRPPSPPSNLDPFSFLHAPSKMCKYAVLTPRHSPLPRCPRSALSWPAISADHATHHCACPPNTHPPLRLPSPPWPPILYQIWRKKTLQWHIWSTTTFSLSNSWSSIHLVLQPTICDDCWDVGFFCQDDLGDVSLLQRKMQMSVKTELATTSTPCIGRWRTISSNCQLW